MKKISLIALILCIALLACGCGKEEKAAKLSFSDSANIETLNELSGKAVTITGYMATISPLDGSYIYLMNMPYQSCPFCVPNSTQLSNTMAVFAAEGSKFDFTDRPIQVSGTLKVEDRVDDYGYSYNYFIDDAQYEILDLSNISQEYALYQSLAEEGIIGDVNAMFDYLSFVCQWTEYTGSSIDESGNEITYFLYPGDVENILADEGPYGYAAQASDGYFPGLMQRAENAGSDELKQIISAAREVERFARSELEARKYTYDEETDKFTLNNNDALYGHFYAAYMQFSQWLASYEL